MRKYFLHTDNGQEGPLSLEDLRSKDLKHNTPVWAADLEDWTHAGKIDELKEFVTTTPLPFFKETHNAVALERPLPKTVDSAPVPRSNSKLVLALIVIAITILAVLAVYYRTR